MFFFKTVFCSFHQAFDIAAVTVNRNGGDGAEKDQHRHTFCGQISNIEKAENKSKDGQSDGGGDAGDGNVTGDKKKHHPENQSAQQRQRSQGKRGTGSGTDTFASLEFEIHGEHVSQNGDGSGSNGNTVMSGQCDLSSKNGDRSFEQIKNKTDLALNRSDGTGHVGCTHVAGTDFADINAMQFTDDQGKGNGTEKIGKNTNKNSCD